MQEGKKHGGLRIKIPVEVQEQIRVKYLAGEKLVDIACELGVSRSAAEKATRDIRENRHENPEQPEGTVYCDASISSKCRYGATVNTQFSGLCNYILITGGHKRGCPWEACTKFEKVDKHHMRYEFGLSNLFERKVSHERDREGSGRNV